MKTQKIHPNPPPLRNRQSFIQAPGGGVSTLCMRHSQLLSQTCSHNKSKHAYTQLCTCIIQCTVRAALWSCSVHILSVYITLCVQAHLHMDNFLPVEWCILQPLPHIQLGKPSILPPLLPILLDQPLILLGQLLILLGQPLILLDTTNSNQLRTHQLHHPPIHLKPLQYNTYSIYHFHTC